MTRLLHDITKDNYILVADFYDLPSLFVGTKYHYPFKHISLQFVNKYYNFILISFDDPVKKVDN